MSPEQRAALARQQLVAARNLLDGVQLEHELGIPLADFVPTVLERYGREDQRRQLTAAFRDLLESEQLLDQAATALSSELRIPARDRLAQGPVDLEQPEARARLIGSAQMQRSELDRLEQLARS